MKHILIAFIFLSTFASAQNYDVIQVPAGGSTIDCNQEGSAKEGRPEWKLNPEKNRWDFPSDGATAVKLEVTDLIPATGSSKYKVGQFVEITGYVFNVKPGGVETCNCKTTSNTFKDTHIEITPSADETGPESRIIVEVTPRFRMQEERQGVDWSTTTLKEKLIGHTVKFQGYLFYDLEHEGQAFSTNPKNAKGTNWRASCWEIHPLTSIELPDEVDEANFSSGTDNVPHYAVQGASTPTSNDTSPINMLAIVLLGAMLGAAGQVARIVPGLKKG